MLRLRPISLRDANEYVRKHHRHHKPVAGHKFSIGCEADGELVGVIIAGRPVSRYLDDGFTLEVTSLCTNGAKNACSFLYGAAARAAAAMGYKRIITYTLESENGASLRASGWICQGKAGGLRWTGKRQPKEDHYPAQMNADADAFLSGIVRMTGDLVKAYPFLSDAEAQRFGTGREEIGKCPRCGSPVYVGKGNFYCSNKACSFCLWEDNKFFSSKKKKLTKRIAKELLDKGWCRVTGLYTPKKPQLYDAVIRLDDSGGKYVSFKMEFDK